MKQFTKEVGAPKVIVMNAVREENSTKIKKFKRYQNYLKSTGKQNFIG